MLKKYSIHGIVLKELTESIKDYRIRNLVIAFLLEDAISYSDKMHDIYIKFKSGDLLKFKIEKEINEATNDLIKKCEQIERRLKQKNILKKVKELFRQIVGKWIYRGRVVKRSFRKPRGYPGDFRIMEIIYEALPITDGFGYYCDKYFLKNDYVSAVRNRVTKMEYLLENFISNSNSKKIDILNLGCGSCREIRALVFNRALAKRNILFNLVDQDKEALKFSKRNLKVAPSNIKFNFIQEGILDLTRKDIYKSKLKGQDLIYSIGLADYLPDLVLGRLLKFCIEMLKPNGRLVIAHKNVRKYSDLVPDWFCDWYFIPRDRTDLAELIKLNLGNSYKIFNWHEEKSKRISFFTIVKKK